MAYQFSAFTDIPDIWLSEAAHLQDGSRWSDRNAYWTDARPDRKGFAFPDPTMGLDAAPASAVSNMQRYLREPSRPLFEVNSYQLGSKTGCEDHCADPQSLFVPQPLLPYAGGGYRQKSPDNYHSTWSESSTSSYNFSHKDDGSNSFGSSERGSSPPHGAHDLLYSDRGTYPLISVDEATLGAGGSCTLADIQSYPSAEEVEPPIAFDDCFRMEMGTLCAQETVLFKDEMATDEHHCPHPHEEDTIRVRDAESVKPVVKIEDETDSDWEPASTQRRRRALRSSGGYSRGTARRGSRSKVTRSNRNVTQTLSGASGGRNRISKHTQTNSTSKDDSQADRRFPCPFARYSCTSTFASKNEWKRHVNTQHIRLGFWRCQLCKTAQYNDFNRKDLFTQHLRRMHMDQKPSPADDPITEDNMAVFQERCYSKSRDAPPCSECLFCNRTFEGPGSWEDRVEHVGRHLEKEDRGVDTSTYSLKGWREDRKLEKWLCDEGLIERDARGNWQLGCGAPA